MADYSELKRLAEAATPGPWSTESNEMYWLEDGYTKHLMETFDGSDICHDAEHPANLKFIAAANPAAVLELITELEKVKADCKACWEEFKAQGRQLDLVKDENENLHKDARRWQCVRNAIPLQSPYAVWREGSHLVLGKDADELVDSFLSHAKEAIHD